MRLALGAIVLAALPAGGAGAAASELLGELTTGPHAVGFRVIERYDASRPFRAPLDLDGRPRTVTVARPMQVGVWYPAAAGAGAPMRLGQYVELMGAEQDFEPAGDARRRAGEAAYFAFDVVRGATDEQRQRLLALETVAVRDAEPRAGSFPLVVWSLGSPAVYHASAEYLASHGYVVAIMPRVPPTRSVVDTSPTLADYEAKSRDMAFVVQELSRWPNADVRRIGLTGFSAGGRWAIAEAMRNPSVRAVVSQDSVMLFGDDGGQLARMPAYDPDRVRVPVLHLIRREWVPRETSDLWTAMRYAERTRVVFEEPLDHLDFTAMGYAATLVGLRPEARAAVRQAFLALNRATRWFFDAHVKDDAAARARVERLDRELGLPAAFAVVERSGAARPVPDETQFTEALVDDFARAVALYRSLKAERGEPPIAERPMNLVGYQLLGIGRTRDAVEVLTLNAEAFPSSANVYDSLADAHLAAGDREQALALARRCLDALAADTSPEARRELIRRSAQDKVERLTRGER
jgi:dienelactone hydrolase